MHKQHRKLNRRRSLNHKNLRHVFSIENNCFALRIETSGRSKATNNALKLNALL